MPKKDQKQTKKKTAKEVIIENLKVLGEAYLIAFFIRLLFLEAFAIPTGSMIPTIMEGDRIIVIKPTYGINFPIVNVKLPGFYHPQRGDIVVFKNPTYRSPGLVRELITLLTFSVINVDNEPKYFVKRIMGVPGDTVELKDNELYINGKKVERTFIRDDGYWKYYKEFDWVVRFKSTHVLDDGIIRDFSISNLVVLYDQNYRSLMMSYGIPETSLPNLEYFKNDLVRIRASILSNKIPDGYYLAMGDNRDESSDSRYWGLVPEDLILGKGVFKFWPLNRVGPLK